MEAKNYKEAIDSALNWDSRLTSDKRNAYRRFGFVFDADCKIVTEMLQRLDSQIAELRIKPDGIGVAQFDRSDPNKICPAVDVYAFKWSHDLPKCTERRALLENSDHAIIQLISLLSVNGLHPMGKEKH